MILNLLGSNFGLLAPTALAVSGVPRILSYQGRLADASGNLLGSSSGTTYYFKFSIWNNATVGSGVRLWPTAAPTSVAATVTSGVFNMNIGDTANGYPDALDYNFNTNQDVFLQVEVSSDNSSFDPLSPRLRVAASSFAELSGAVSGTTTPSTFGTTTPIGFSQVTIEATSSTAIPITLRAASGQTANLLQIQNAAGANLVFVNASGGLFASSTLQATGDAIFYGNLGVGTTSPAAMLAVQGNGLFSGDISGANLTATGTTRFNGVTYTWPSSVTNGNFLQVDSNGNLSWATPSLSSAGGWTDAGTLVHLTTQTDNLSVGTTSAEVTSVMTIAATSTATTNLSLRTLTGQTGDALRITRVSQDSTSTLFTLDASGGFIATASSTAASTLQTTGALSASSTLGVSGAARFYSTLRADDLATLTGFLTTSSSTASAGLIVAGAPLQASSTLLVSGLSTLGGGFVTSASSTIMGTTTVGSLIATSTLAVRGSGTSTFEGGISVGGGGLASSQGLVVSGGAIQHSGANFVVQAGGNVGIGTTSPASLLSVHGGALIAGTTTVQHLIATSTLAVGGATGDRFIVTQGGNVGIGTAAPGAKLQVNTGADATIGQIIQSNSATQSANLTEWRNSSGNVVVAIKDTTSGGNASGLITAHDNTPADPTSGISQGAHFGLNGSDVNFYGIGLGAVRNSKYDMWFQTGAINGGGYRFYTGTSEKVTFDKNGNVGIGSTTPSQLFSVQGNSYLAGTSTLAGPVVATGTLAVTGFSTFTGGFLTAASSTIMGTTTVGSLIATSTLAVRGSGTSTFEGGISVGGGGLASSQGLVVSGGAIQHSGANFVVQAGGNVGIGTTSPSQLLSVQGNAYFSGNLTNVANVTATGTLTVMGNIGIGTTTPYSKLSVWGANTTSGVRAFEVTNSASTTNLSIDNAGFFSIGTSDGAALSNLFTVDAVSGTTTIANLSIGNIVFDTNAGVVNLSDLPVDSNAASGVQEAQMLNIGGTPVLIVSGISDGSGGVTNLLTFA